MKKLNKVLISLVALGIMMFAMSISVSAAPGKVEGLKQTDSSKTSLDIAWDSAILCEYDVQISDDNVNFMSVSNYTSSSTTKYIYGLSAGKTYYVRVRATQDNGDTFGPFSDSLAVVTNPEQPEKPMQSGATTSSITIKWTASAGASYYNVYAYTGNNKVFIGKTTTNSCTITKLSNKAQLAASYYEVSAVRDSGSYQAESYMSTAIYRSNLRLVPAKLSAPQVRYYWANLNEMSLVRYEVPFADGYQYEVYKNTAKKPFIKITSSSYSAGDLKGLSANSFYKIRVRAYSLVNGAKKYGAWSDCTYAAFEPKCELKKLNQGKAYKFSWKKTKGATNYTVYMSTNRNTGYKKVATTKKLSCKITKFKKKKLDKKKTYYFRVVANKKVGKKTYKSDSSTYYYVLF